MEVWRKQRGGSRYRPDRPGGAAPSRSRPPRAGPGGSGAEPRDGVRLGGVGPRARARRRPAAVPERRTAAHRGRTLRRPLGGAHGAGRLRRARDPGRRRAVRAGPRRPPALAGAAAGLLGRHHRLGGGAGERTSPGTISWRRSAGSTSTCRSYRSPRPTRGLPRGLRRRLCPTTRSTSGATRPASSCCWRCSTARGWGVPGWATALFVLAGASAVPAVLITLRTLGKVHSGGPATATRRGHRPRRRPRARPGARRSVGGDLRRRLLRRSARLGRGAPGARLRPRTPRRRALDVRGGRRASPRCLLRSCRTGCSIWA